MPKDDNNVVKLRQPPAKVAGVGVDDPIMPKSILNMTPVEQEVFLNVLRERRLRAAAVIKAAVHARHHADSVVTMMKLERKAELAAKQYERVSKAFDKLEEMLYSLRTATLQHTDVDITKVPDEPKPKK